jgi:hypothetical protein
LILLIGQGVFILREGVRLAQMGLGTAIVRQVVGSLWAPVLLMIVVITALMILGRSLRTVARRSCLRLGLCPACGYEIGSLPAATDGCTVCPECGAAWRLPT